MLGNCPVILAGGAEKENMEGPLLLLVALISLLVLMLQWSEWKKLLLKDFRSPSRYSAYSSFSNGIISIHNQNKKTLTIDSRMAVGRRIINSDYLYTIIYVNKCTNSWVFMQYNWRREYLHCSFFHQRSMSFLRTFLFYTAMFTFFLHYFTNTYNNLLIVFDCSNCVCLFSPILLKFCRFFTIFSFTVTFTMICHVIFSLDLIWSHVGFSR